MSRRWRIVRTAGEPCYIRDCTQFAAVPVLDEPAKDLASALPRVDGFALAVYGESKLAVDLALTLGKRSGARDLGRFGATYREVKNTRRMAIVHGQIIVADGRTDPAFFGGQGRLLEDSRRWEAGHRKEMPIQIRRLRELEEAGVDLVEFPTNAAVDLKFGRLNLAQPVVISRRLFREGEENGRVIVEWL